MPDYRRAFQPGGTFFFTLVTGNRQPIFRNEATHLVLHHAIAETAQKRPFELIAIVLLFDHLHLVLKLPESDADFAGRIRLIKQRFSFAYGNSEAGLKARPTFARESRGELNIWQQRYWEHVIRDDHDLHRHLDYIHFNPVKHGYVQCPHAWKASSFHRFVAKGAYEMNWCCSCNSKIATPDFNWSTNFDLE